MLNAETQLRKNGIFDIEEPSQFFDSILRVFERYKSSRAKNVEDLLYVIMGLNHLREWIAPGYRPDTMPQSSAESFYAEIWDEEPNFQTMNALCNRTKHLASVKAQTSSTHDLDIDEWPDVDSVRSFDLGPASGYQVDGRDVSEVCEEVIAFYQARWFAKNEQA